MVPPWQSMQSPAKLDDIDGSLDDLVNKLRTLKEQDMYTSSTLPNPLPATFSAHECDADSARHVPWQEGKRERPDGLRTLQQRIEQVKVPSKHQAAACLVLCPIGDTLVVAG